MLAAAIDDVDADPVASYDVASRQSRMASEANLELPFHLRWMVCASVSSRK